MNANIYLEELSNRIPSFNKIVCEECTEEDGYKTNIKKLYCITSELCIYIIDNIKDKSISDNELKIVFDYLESVMIEYKDNRIEDTDIYGAILMSFLESITNVIGHGNSIHWEDIEKYLGPEMLDGCIALDISWGTNISGFNKM